MEEVREKIEVAHQHLEHVLKEYSALEIELEEIVTSFKAKLIGKSEGE